jgi:hypothetical protein
LRSRSLFEALDEALDEEEEDASEVVKDVVFDGRDANGRDREEVDDADDNDDDDDDDADNGRICDDTNASKCERNVGLFIKMLSKACTISSLFARTVKRLLKCVS